MLLLLLLTTVTIPAGCGCIVSCVPMADMAAGLRGVVTLWVIQWPQASAIWFLGLPRGGLLTHLDCRSSRFPGLLYQSFFLFLKLYFSGEWLPSVFPFRHVVAMSLYLLLVYFVIGDKPTKTSLKLIKKNFCLYFLQCVLCVLIRTALNLYIALGKMAF